MTAVICSDPEACGKKAQEPCRRTDASIGNCKVARKHPGRMTLAEQNFDLIDDPPGLAAPRSGIQAHAAAEGSGNPRHEPEAGQFLALDELGKPGAMHAGLCIDLRI